MTAKRSTPRAIRRHMTPFERVAADVRRGNPDECWLWIGPRNRWGYGRFTSNYEERLAHRVAYEMAHGAIPDGLVVRHRCDNPPCCNPAHLELGTPADNHADCVERGRHTFGIACHSAKLTPALVIRARELRRAGALYRELAAKFGVSEPTIRKAVVGENWKQVGELTPYDLQPA